MTRVELLVVDDSPTQLEALRALLDAEGYSVHVARSGEEALGRIERGGIDLVLSDVVMPGMSGYELCSAIKRRFESGEEPPVVLLTSLADPTDIVRGLECGADNYITKPYDPTHLVARLRHVLDNRELRRRQDDGASVPIRFLGETFEIGARREQILDLLLSSFEELIRTNDALQESKRALADAHARVTGLYDSERQARAEAEAATRIRDEVLAIVSHDLRNPLGLVFSGTSMLLEMDLDEEQRNRQLRILKRAAQRMERLISDLLEVSRLESGRLTVSTAPVPVAELIADAAEAFRPLAAEKGIRLSVAGGAAGDVTADRERIAQVFSNLIGNAIKFTPEEGSVRIGARVEGNGAVFHVADSGPGIDEADLPRIFDRFWQAKQSAHAGAGLGLAIAKGIVEAHDGRIWAESAPGRGATFYFSIPLAAPRVASGAAEPT